MDQSSSTNQRIKCETQMLTEELLLQERGCIRGEVLVEDFQTQCFAEQRRGHTAPVHSSDRQWKSLTSQDKRTFAFSFFIFSVIKLTTKACDKPLTSFY